jgi:hypothetical protein
MNPHICPKYFSNVPKTYNGEKMTSSTNVTGESDYLPSEN